MWHVTPLQHIPVKMNKMSIMVSMKYQTYGHKYRHSLVTEILKKGLPIDIYGRGCDLYKVKSGDTLSQIAYKYRTSIKNIKKWNNIKGSKSKICDNLIIYTKY